MSWTTKALIIVFGLVSLVMMLACYSFLLPIVSTAAANSSVATYDGLRETILFLPLIIPGIFLLIIILIWRSKR